MKVRLGTLREFLREAFQLEQASVPGRWDPRHGEPVDDEELASMGESDERMEGDSSDGDIAPHLRSDEDGLTLGDQVEESVNVEIRAYMLQEQEDDEQAPPDVGAGESGESASDGAEPAAPTGFYTPFDMNRDHSSTWYRSPGQPAGSSGDPFRGEDPHSQLGFHPPGGSEDGKPLAPPIWQLSAGGDTSKVLGANAKPDSGGVDSGDGSKESEAPGGDSEGDEAEGEEQGEDRPSNR